MSRHAGTCRRPVASEGRLSDTALAAAVFDLGHDGRVYLARHYHALQVQVAAPVPTVARPMAAGAGWVVVVEVSSDA